MTSLDANALVNLAGAVFIAPFMLFSATAGQLADKYEKSRLIRWIKILEIAIMAIGLAGFWQRDLVAAVHGARADGRAFDAVRPGQVRDPAAEPLDRGAGRRQRPGRDGDLRRDPARHDRRRARRRDPPERARHRRRRRDRRRGGGLSREPRDSGHAAGRRPTSRSTGIRSPRPGRTCASRSATASSGCRCSASRGSGSTARSSSPSSPAFSREILGGDEHVVTFLLAAFSVGVGAGSLLCERLSGRKIELGLVPFGSIGLTVFAVDLWLASRGLIRAAARRASAHSSRTARTGACRSTSC